MSQAEAILKDIEKGKLAPVYFLFGVDEYPILEIAKKLRQTVATGAMAQFNCDELSGGALSWIAIVERARTLPMMASRRIVLAWGVDKLLKSRDGIELFEQYLQSPSKETVLVLTAIELDKRLRLVKMLHDVGAVVFESKHPTPRELPRIIKQFAQAFGKQFDDDAAAALADLVGVELSWIRNEVDKLCLYVGERPRVTVADVRCVMADIGVHEIWDLTDALARRDFVQSMRLLATVLKENEQPPAILGALARQFRMIAQIKRMQAARYSGEAIARTLGLTWQLDKFLGYARAFGTGEVSHIYRQLEEADLRLKRSTQSPHLVLEALIADICLA